MLHKLKHGHIITNKTFIEKILLKQAGKYTTLITSAKYTTLITSAILKMNSLCTLTNI